MTVKKPVIIGNDAIASYIGLYWLHRRHDLQGTRIQNMHDIMVHCKM